MIATHEKMKMPRNLPMTNPIIIARDIPLTIVDGFMSRRNIQQEARECR